MHAAMAIFNAWCDRVPILILGATGPVDATQRRPWIDWLHTSQDQASIVRPYIKWGRSAGLTGGGAGVGHARASARVDLAVCADLRDARRRLARSCRSTTPLADPRGRSASRAVRGAVSLALARSNGRSPFCAVRRTR